ncbi:hypothetical protein JAAARDRAFT_591741 [Jaapia argillacea MUCL 33604]|uniref:Uncharacterized protein n=1 Tax=Jaapia argillacea MUCL 33604 TaxID=933084 RepID=A0A067PI09_9AGAM|nr:hypothetical protein JAAARDRAFT_591741 [Jaapia argillacea MUCL 33604]
MGDHNAAQSALFISEIFQHICERATKMDSYRLALTSQAFKEAALGRLWEEMDSLEPLLKLIPSLGMTCERDGVIHPRRNWVSLATPCDLLLS